MSEFKTHQFKPPLYHANAAHSDSSPRSTLNSNARGREQQGWDAYRKWLSTVSGKPSSERALRDHSIYSWKGYQNWADKVKQSWKPEEG